MPEKVLNLNLFILYFHSIYKSLALFSVTKKTLLPSDDYGHKANKIQRYPGTSPLLFIYSVYVSNEIKMRLSCQKDKYKNLRE